MSSDNVLAADVSDELFWDPKVDNAEIAVSANDGTITLRGTVGSLRQKREAKKAAQRVFGVISVENLHQSDDVSVLFAELIICTIAADDQISSC